MTDECLTPCPVAEGAMGLLCTCGNVVKRWQATSSRLIADRDAAVRTAPRSVRVSYNSYAPTLASVPLTPDEARELSRAARQVTSWTERRNTLIRAAFERGAGIREIAKATGLNVGTVHTMLHGRKR